MPACRHGLFLDKINNVKLIRFILERRIQMKFDFENDEENLNEVENEIENKNENEIEDKIENEDEDEDEKEIEYKEHYKTGLFTGILIGAGSIFAIIILMTVISGLSKNSAISDRVAKLTGKDKESYIYDLIEDKYYKDVDEKTLAEGNYKGMVESLNDPYSVYYTKEEFEKVKESDSGKYVGIGATVSTDEETGYTIINAVTKNSSAEEAGIIKNDLITSVDGEDVKNYDLNDVVSKVRGEEGTKVKLGVLRNGETLELEVTRKEVEIEIVYTTMLEGNIGYLYLAQFNENSAKQVKDALDKLKNRGMERLIFDVRDNPGGLTDQVLDIMNNFLPKDSLLLSYKEKDGSGEEYKATRDGEYQDIPMVVLVDGGSASASEAFSGCMKSYGRAKIVGEKTFGKGIMQELYSLSDGSAISLTIAKYYLPDGSNIHEVGIEPDITVAYETDENGENADIPAEDILENEDGKLYLDSQLKKAIEVVKEN